MHRQNSLRVQSAVRGLRILLFNVKTSSSIDGRALGIIYNDVVKFSLLSARSKKKKKKKRINCFRLSDSTDKSTFSHAIE